MLIEAAVYENLRSVNDVNVRETDTAAIISPRGIRVSYTYAFICPARVFFILFSYHPAERKRQKVSISRTRGDFPRYVRAACGHYIYRGAGCTVRKISGIFREGDTGDRSLLGLLAYRCIIFDIDIFNNF